MTMLEKAARALCALDGNEWGELTMLEQVEYTEQARAVLEAVRDSADDGVFSATQLAEPKWPSIQCDNRKELNLSFNQPKWEAAFRHILNEGKSNDAE